MTNRQKIFRLLPVVMATILLSSQTALATYLRITLENLSPNVLTPVPFITHNGAFDLFDQGAAASSQVEALAEGGDTTGVVALAMSAQSAGDVLDYKILSNGGPLTPGSSASIDIKADSTHGWLSYLSMFAFSNDAFIGGTTGDGAIALFNGSAPLYGTYYITPSDVWDAGTEVNDQLAANVPALMGMGGVDEGGVITLNHPGINPMFGDIAPSFNWTGRDYVASITIEKSPVPEPATMVLFGTGLLGLAGICAKRKRVERRKN